MEQNHRDWPWLPWLWVRQDCPDHPSELVTSPSADAPASFHGLEVVSGSVYPDHQIK
jgi:hypothetical protein